MEAVLAPIVVAVIGGPLMWALRRFDRRNTEQHDRNMSELERIGRTVERVDEKMDRLDSRLDDHLSWHLDHDWRSRSRRDSA